MLAEKSDPTLARLVEDFVQSCRAAGRSPKTWRDAYGYPLRAVLLPFCQRDGIREPSQLDRDALDRLAIELHERQPALSKASVKSYLKAVNQFLAWYERTSKSSQARAPLPKLRKQVREVLSPAELADLEAAAPTERDRLIIRVMAETGAREGEVTHLRISDLVLQERRFSYLKLRGKTGERTSPISPALYRRLKAYADKSRPRDATSERFFLSLRRRAGSYAALTAGGVYQVVKDAALRAEFPKRIYPHLLRHSAITHMVDKGLPPFTISENVGCSLQLVMDVYNHPSAAQRWTQTMRIWEED